MKLWQEEQLKCLCDSVRPLDGAAMTACRSRWDGIAKPLNGLGEMEQMLVKIAGIRQSADIDITRKAVVVFCSDNGVVAEGVTQTDSSVTAAAARHIAAGTASVNRIAQTAGADVIPVDVGIASELHVPGLADHKISYGTANLSREPAMSREQALQAIHVGISLAGKLKDAGYHVLAAGEMGIGNTTTSSAVAGVMLGLSAEQVTGRGAGLSDEGYRRKVAVITEAVRHHQVSDQDLIGLLAAVGGYDIAAMAGLYIGGAIYRIPVVLDGMIAATAGLLAAGLCRLVPDYLLPSHLGREPACALALQRLGLNPVIHAEMALGEGTGAVMLFPLLDMAAAVYRQGYTFEDGNITTYQRFEALGQENN